MSKRLTKALLRLCELEKQAQEDVIAHLRNEISENTLEANELCDRVTELRSLLARELETSARLRDEAFQVGKWVHIGEWHWHGERCIVAGLNEDRTTGVFERRMEGWFVYGRRPEIHLAAAPLYVYELPDPPETIATKGLRDCRER